MNQLRVRDVGPGYAAVLQNKTFGTHKVPQGWIIVAAGNPACIQQIGRGLTLLRWIV